MRKGSKNSFSECLPKTERINQRTTALIKRELKRSNLPWLLGFSGGKDSSALLKLVYRALRETSPRDRKPVTVIYCDTGVEIPIVRDVVVSALRNLEREAKVEGLPLRFVIAEPRLTDRFFVKVIGRGYPPPSNKFRWCTDRLRIAPVQRVLAAAGQRCVVLLGIRKGESEDRDRRIEKHATASHYYLRQASSPNAVIFGPILDYSLDEVWGTLALNDLPRSIDVKRLTVLYKEASGECPIVRDPQGSPCGKGRFGCWTCTVVRQDRAVQNMVREGHVSLGPLLTWRNWLVSIRDEPEYRCAKRRNGREGPGPFRLKARRELLRRLRLAEKEAGLPLIGAEEIAEIHRLWRKDRRSIQYREGR